MRFGRLIPSNNVRRSSFLKSISKAIYTQNPDDVMRLREAKDALGETTEINRVDRCRFVRRFIGDGNEAAERVKDVICKFQDADRAAAINLSQSCASSNVEQSAGIEPIITDRVLRCVQQQLVHLRNGCCADSLDHLPYTAVGRVRYKGGQIMLTEFRSSSRGTSRCEAIHSVLTKSFSSLNGLAEESFDARLSLLISAYNRRRLLSLGYAVPEPGLTPKEIELGMACGAAEYSDYSLAPTDCKDLPKVGFEYGRMCNQQASEFTIDSLSPEALTSAEMKAILTFEGEWDGEGCNSELESQVDPEDSDNSTVSFESASGLSSQGDIRERTQDTGLFTTNVECSESDEVPTARPSDDALFGSVSKLRAPRNVSKRRALTGAAQYVGPNFNNEMESIWTTIFSEQSIISRGSRAELTKKCLAQYSTIQLKAITDARKSGYIAPPLLEVSLALADLWVKEKLLLRASAAVDSVFDTDSRNAMSALSAELDKVPPAAAAAFAKPTLPADHPIPQSFPSEGPAAVTIEEFRREVDDNRANKIVEKGSTSSTSKSKKGLCPYCHLPLE
ncbi:hypothetical protein FOL47_002234, partial [Perkinsus chesapeaki]